MRFAKIAAVVVIVLGTLASCGGSSPTAQRPTTTAAASCRLEGATTEPSTGAAALEAGAPAALLRNVQVQASDCADAIVFSFWKGLPEYQIAYERGPFTADPSGRSVHVAGSAFLRVRLSPATGVDLSGSEPYETYAGGKVLTPGAPGQVAEVHELGDFEAVTTWVIGLDAGRPYLVTTENGALVIRVEAPARRTPACTTDGVTVHPPEGWYAELADPWACRFYDDAPFVIEPNTDSITWSVTVGTEAVPFAESVDRWTQGSVRLVSSRDGTVDGHPARIIEVEETGEALYPAGYRSYAYVVDRGGDGTVTISATPGLPGAAFTALQRDVDRFAASATIGAPTCSATPLTGALPADPGLPPAVAAMRADLAAAATACDYTTLAALVDRNGRSVRYTFGEGNDPIGEWRALESQREGVLPLRALRVLLGLPHAAQDLGNGHTMYVWPAAFASEHPTGAQLEEIAATGLYDMETLQSWIAGGMNYLGYRILISDTGDWQAFVAGD